MKIIEEYDLNDTVTCRGHALIYDELAPGTKVKWRGHNTAWGIIIAVKGTNVTVLWSAQPEMSLFHVRERWQQQ